MPAGGQRYSIDDPPAGNDGGELTTVPSFAEHDALNAGGAAGHGVAGDQRGAHLGVAFGGFEFAGHSGEEFFQDQILFHADYAVIGAAHAYVGLVGGSAGEHALVGGGDVGVRAQNGGDAAIQVPAHRHLLAGGFCVEVYHDDFGFDVGEQRVGGVEGIVGGVHENAALELDHRVGNAALRGSLIDAPAGNAGLEIGGTQDSPPALVALGGRGVHRVDQLALVPDVIAGGQHVRAQVEKLLGQRRRNAEAAGGVFGVDDDEFDVVRFTEMADVLAHDAASRAAEDVADEEDVQIQLLNAAFSYQLSAFSKNLDLPNVHQLNANKDYLLFPAEG